MILQWFLRRSVRQAWSMQRHIGKLLNHQRDILSPQGLEALGAGLNAMRTTLAQKAPTQEILKGMEALEQCANKWLKPYPHASWRENVEVLLVALAIAMGIRTFFLQPFKIPTGSMQPTLYGVTSDPDFSRAFQGLPVRNSDQPIVVPTGLERVRQWFAGVSYLVIKSKADGPLEAVNQPFKILIFNIYQTLKIGGVTHTILFPPDYGSLTLAQRAGLAPGTPYKKGDEVVRMRLIAGDHLFVDRLMFNFRGPKRGEIIVFETKGIPQEGRDRFGIPGDQFYIKRLVGLGDERIDIVDRRLVINGQPLTAAVPHFERLYSFNPQSPAKESSYSGHVKSPGLAPFFAHQEHGVRIPKRHMMAMGDNTLNSLDSRAWGTVPSDFVIGKAFFVYWPLSERFGWGYHR